MKAKDALYFKNRKEWRSWLGKNHKKAKEVWLLYYKKHTKKPRIPYDDAVEEAICFGWIDGKVRSIDEESFMQRYCPRRKNSIWSLLNKKRAKKMIKEKKMMKDGLEKIEEAKKNGKWQVAYTSKKQTRMPLKLKKALMKNKKAWKNFEKFSISTKNTYIWWIISPKREETKERRIKQVVKRSAENKKIID
jgi:uncharacterized protein YdeI (YjbR/CyaY-like superfamily)